MLLCEYRLSFGLLALHAAPRPRFCLLRVLLNHRLRLRSSDCSSRRSGFFRLLDIVHADQKLYLVFEFLDVDLKRYMENANKSGRPITSAITKVGPRLSHASPTHPASCALSARIYAYMTRARTVRRVATRPQDCHYLTGV